MRREEAQKRYEKVSKHIAICGSCRRYYKCKNHIWQMENENSSPRNGRRKIKK